MDRKALPIVAAAVLLLAAAVPAAFAAEGANPRIAALQVRVQNMTTGDVQFLPIDQNIPIENGTSYRISLVGTDSLRDSRGDIGVQARFTEAAGRGAIALGNSGGNWVIVEPTNRSQGRAELAYQVQGTYNMPAAWRTGRIRLDLGGFAGGTASGNARLAARVENMGTGRVEFVDLGGNERIPIAPGQRLRVSLVERDNHNRAVPADFDLASRSGLVIERSGGNWVMVRGTDDRANAQLAFTPENGRYRNGRIGFDLNGSGFDDDYAEVPSNVTDRARWEQSEDLVALLYRSLLQVEPGSERDFTRDVRLVYDQGLNGLRDLARNLAREADARDTFEGERDVEVVADLYRDLLGRNLSSDELYRTDSGFRSFVDRLDNRDGLAQVVDGIVTSDEFRRVQDLDDHGLLRSARY